MSSVLGSATPVGYMQLSGLGMITIEVNLMPGNSTIYNIDIACDHRMDVIHMETKPDETIDQFCQRLRGMMRALWQGQPVPERPVESEKDGVVLTGLKKLAKQLNKKVL